MKNIITIGRELGSGGRTIGKKIAAELGIKYYDRELIDEAAKESGLSAEFIEKTENILEVDGMMNIFDFFELVEYDSREFESAYTTLGGWCTEMLEDFPEVGEKFSFEYMDFEILEMDDLRVEKVKVTINAKTDDDE